MVGKYSKECSIFPSHLPPSIVAMRIELFVLQWSSVTSQ